MTINRPLASLVTRTFEFIDDRLRPRVAVQRPCETPLTQING